MVWIPGNWGNRLKDLKSMNVVHQQIFFAMKITWLFRVYIGDYTTQLGGQHNKPL